MSTKQCTERVAVSRTVIAVVVGVVIGSSCVYALLRYSTSGPAAIQQDSAAVVLTDEQSLKTNGAPASVFLNWDRAAAEARIPLPSPRYDERIVVKYDELNDWTTIQMEVRPENGGPRLSLMDLYGGKEKTHTPFSVDLVSPQPGRVVFVVDGDRIEVVMSDYIRNRSEQHYNLTTDDLLRICHGTVVRLVTEYGGFDLTELDREHFCDFAAAIKK